MSHGDTADNPDDGESTDRDGSQGLYLENKESRLFSSQDSERSSSTSGSQVKYTSQTQGWGFVLL